MNTEVVSTILKDVTSSQKLVNRVLRDNNMQIVHDFTPVKSEYKLNLGNKDRVTLTLNGDEFVQKEEHFAYGKWRPSIEFRFKDTAKTAEDALMAAIEFLKFKAGREYGNRILDDFMKNFFK